MRPQLGQAVSAANLRALLAGSAIVASHRHGDDRVQDAYSLRCTPQVHGAARDTVEHARAVADRELVSFIDNPVVLPDGRVESCGNFHGAPVAAVADFLAISIADVGAISERRTDRLLDPQPVARPAAVPVARRRGQLGADDRPVHAGGDGRREPPPGRPGEHRHAADERDAGGPRLARLVGGPQAARGRGQPGPHPGRRADRRQLGPRPAPPAGARRRDGGRRRGRRSPPPADRVPTSGWRPAWPPSSGSSPTARSSPPPTSALAPRCAEPIWARTISMSRRCAPGYGSRPVVRAWAGAAPAAGRAGARR